MSATADRQLTTASHTVPDTGALQRVSRMRIFFGHQSVGANILQGVREIAASQPAAPLTLVSSGSPETVEGAAFVETQLGQNGNPASKADAFAAVLGRGWGESGGVAMYKYCYLDVQPETDPVRLFEDYRARMEDLRARYPDLTLVHLTMPLTVVEPPSKRLVKRLLGKPTAVDLNAKRNAYNERLRTAYEGNSPIFDLARLQSTRSDGQREFIVQGGDTVFTLAPEWTDDGGHLNAQGRRLVAGELISFLGQLEARR